MPANFFWAERAFQQQTKKKLRAFQVELWVVVVQNVPSGLFRCLCVRQ